MKRLLPIALLLLIMSFAALAADVTGTWTGTAVVTLPDGQALDRTAHFVLKQDGTAITGTAGPSPEEQVPIQKGRVEGSKVTVEIAVEDANFVFTLVLENDHLKGEGTGNQGGTPLKVKIDMAKK